MDHLSLGNAMIFSFFSGPEAVRAGVYAACSILLLTSIEGAQAFQIFNPFLYQVLLRFSFTFYVTNISNMNCFIFKAMRL